MKELIQIRFSAANLKTEEIRKSLTNFFTAIVEKANEIDIWDTSIKVIVITDDFKKEVHNQAEKWNIKTHISQEKEYKVASKVLFNHNFENPEHHIFFDYQYFHSENYPFVEIVFGQILAVCSEKIIPQEIRQVKFNYHPSSLSDYVKFASTEWCKAVYTRMYLDKVLSTQTPLMKHNSFLIAFKRKLKKNLFDFNSDKVDKASRLDLFWHNYFESLNILFLRIVENDTDQKEFLINESEPCFDLIYSVIDEIRELTKKCLAQDVYDVTNLKDAIKKFSEHFEVFLENETEKDFEIRLSKDPKDYFIGELVDTEPRIICFLDILGFSELINAYDSDITSTVLQDIQESFAMAKTQLLENKTQQNKNALRHLKYQTFSDNICISIPYFDNENDFLANFNILLTYVRGVQSILMTKGFFTRGGVSIGSYYADDNIIFSKGLVKAYHLESKKAVYPRVIIDKSIIEKIWKFNHERIKDFGFESIVIFDWENTAFLNPFGLLKSTLQQMKSLLNESESDDDPLTKVFSNLTKMVGEMSIDLLKFAEEGEMKSLQLIKNKIVENIYQNHNEENIVSKYVWLLEFIKWIEKDESGKLKFQSLAELMNNSED